MQILRVAVFFVLLVAVASSEKASPQIISNFDEFYPTESDILSTINPDINADINLTTIQLLTKYGYSAEKHHVITDDGYILEMHRITGGPKSPPRAGKKALFIFHGLLDSSATWVLTGPRHGLGYRLADEGYDVWLGNARGNFYTCNHTSLNPFGSKSDRQRFWSFSWHEIGIYDLPKMLDYVLSITNQEKIQYIAHSQGTTAFFVMCSEKPEYNDKIEIMHALAPVAYLSNARSPPIRVLVPFLSILETLSKLIGFYNLSPTNEFLVMAGRNLCRDQAITQVICENILFLIAGYSSDQLNSTMIPVILGHTPAGAATKQLVHYGQEVKSGHFRHFDYGYFGNWNKYGRLTPPDYDLSNVRIPVSIYYAQSDWLAAMKDVERLIDTLPNVVGTYLVPHKSFNHIDFMWGIDAPTLVYNELVEKLRSCCEPNTADTDNAINELFLFDDKDK